MFFIFSKVFEFLIFPLNWILVLLLLSIITKNTILKKQLLWTSLGLLLFFTSPLPINLLSRWWNVKTITLNNIKEKYDVGVVLGGFIKTIKKDPTGFYITNSGDRIIKAIQLYKQGNIKKIFIAGGSGMISVPNFKEGKITADFLQHLCIDSTDILQESSSKNTYENALFTKKKLDSLNQKNISILLITSSYHMRRSIACFKKVGLNVIPFIAESQYENDINWSNPQEYIMPGINNLKYWDVYLHEWVGFITYKLQGYV